MVPPSMDVRCERCKTEYEFDDARITEAGVTVKCTTCGHVFKVKKKALVVTVPVKGDEAQGATPANAAAPQAAGEKPREWKVRQANGNVFNFKELTTLQKWIVERKVARDDEISLTGESWKRLGNIAELASFFQVVEDAQKFSVMQSGPQPSYAPPPQQATQVVPPPAAPPPPATPVANVAPPIPQHSLDSTGVVPPPTPAPPPAREPPPAPAPRKAQVMSAARRTELDEDELRLVKGGGGAGKWLLVLLLLGGIGAAGYFGYFNWYLPQEEAKKAEQEKLAEEERAKLTPPMVAEVDAGVVPDAVAIVEAPVVVDAGIAEVAVPDAGAVIAEPVVDAGTAMPVVKKEPERNYDWYMAQGDRLRDREKASQALDMYGKAADLKPDRAEPVAGRGLALLDMGQKEQAAASFQEALKMNPRYGVAIMGLAETYRAMGRSADAIKYYERYLDVLPNGPEAVVAREAIKRLKSE